MDAFLNAVGITDFVVHNERLADPLNEYARSLAEITKRRNKTDADHLEMAYREFVGGLYSNGEGPYYPAFNMLRCLQEGAKRVKRGKDVLRGVVPQIQEVLLAYDGPRATDELWAQRDTFVIRKGVGVGQSRVIRTRPLFPEPWSLSLPVKVDPEIFDPDVVEQIWAYAGTYAGLGEMRPILGRFTGTVEFVDWDLETDTNLGATSFAKACEIIGVQIDGKDGARQAKHAKA